MTTLTTPQPQYVDNTPSSSGPVAMTHDEKREARRAAFLATQHYPGPVGQILSREILTWEEFGYRFGSGSVMRQLITEIIKAETSRQP